MIKAKLEAVESGIAIFEDEFMLPQIAAAYDQGEIPKMLPNLG